MEGSDVDDALEQAREQFEAEPAEVEADLDVDDGDILQLRKACRLLTAIDDLRDVDGYYTLMIEAAFTAMERTLQFYLIEKDVLDEDEYPQKHEDVYRKGSMTGLYSDEFGERLMHLWKENRSKTYYRDGKAWRMEKHIRPKFHQPCDGFGTSIAGPPEMESGLHIIRYVG